MKNQINSGEQPKTKTSISRNADEYMQDRVELKMNRYSKKANRYKLIFWITASVSMICAATVPVLINREGMEVWATILSLIVTILVGIQGIFHPREHWRNYDMISASLRREEMLFSTQSGEYEKLDENKSFHLFVRRVEDLIANEREETIIMRTNIEDSTLEHKIQSKTG